MKFKLLPVVLLLALPSCGNVTNGAVLNKVDKQQSAASSDSKKLVIGTWYGNQIDKFGDRQEWITRDRADGRFDIEFRITKLGKPTEVHNEAGEWGVAGDILFMITKSVGGRDVGRDAYYDDAYKIKSLDEKQFVYTNVTTGNEFTETKVADDYRLPGLK